MKEKPIARLNFEIDRFNAKTLNVKSKRKFKKWAHNFWLKLENMK